MTETPKTEAPPAETELPDIDLDEGEPVPPVEVEPPASDPEEEPPDGEVSDGVHEIRNEYRNMRCDLWLMREDRTWWEATLTDPRMRRMVRKFEEDLNARIYGLCGATKQDLEVRQQDIADRRTWLRMLKQINANSRIEEKETTIKLFEEDNAVFLQEVRDETDDQILEILGKSGDREPKDPVQDMFETAAETEERPGEPPPTEFDPDEEF